MSILNLELGLLAKRGKVGLVDSEADQASRDLSIGATNGGTHRPANFIRRKYPTWIYFRYE